MKITIAELPSAIWELGCTFPLSIDRSGVTVREYLEERGVRWIFGSSEQADIALIKEDTSRLSVARVVEEARRRFLSQRPYVTLIGEPRELAPAAYFFARRDNTLAVAPGRGLKRLCFASEWIDPQLEGWSRRLDRVCWIARPTPERITIARQLLADGVPLDIYSRVAWPCAGWKGYAEDEVVTSRRYRYRIVCENSCLYGYHSEKLFNSIRVGCVTFYQGDPTLDLSHAAGAFLKTDFETMRMRDELAPEVMKQIDRFMFTDAWEAYSFKSFYDHIITMAKDILDES
jgi:hypothetical protein